MARQTYGSLKISFLIPCRNCECVSMSIILSFVTLPTENFNVTQQIKVIFMFWFNLILIFWVTFFYDFRECANILHNKDWSDEAHKTHFESGVRMGIGTFNLVCLFKPNFLELKTKFFKHSFIWYSLITIYTRWLISNLQVSAITILL